MKEMVRLADLIVSAEYRYAYLDRQFSDYKITDVVHDFCISVKEEDIILERNRANELNCSDAFLESLAFYRKFATSAAVYECVLFHSSALSVDGDAYLFAAPSGTGKSTHARLYREFFGSRVTMINDDKPLIRKVNGAFRVYGTPWNGKHGLSNNLSAPIKGICFLKQGEVNAIRRLNVQEALMASFNQVYRPDDVESLRSVLSLVQTMIMQIPVYELTCTISHDAVCLSYETMKGEKLL